MLITIVELRLLVPTTTVAIQCLYFAIIAVVEFISVAAPLEADSTAGVGWHSALTILTLFSAAARPTASAATVVTTLFSAALGCARFALTRDVACRSICTGSTGPAAAICTTVFACTIRFTFLGVAL